MSEKGNENGRKHTEMGTDHASERIHFRRQRREQGSIWKFSLQLIALFDRKTPKSG